MTYASNRFISPSYRRTLTDWQHNVRAIALGLEALRRVDRYGITKRGEQYAGWKALPAGTGTATHMTTDEAWRVFSTLLGFELTPAERGDADERRAAFRRARAAAHPDRHGGDRTAWDQVEQAAKVLGVLS